jgi:hypothetical protein
MYCDIAHMLEAAIKEGGGEVQQDSSPSHVVGPALSVLQWGANGQGQPPSWATWLSLQDGCEAGMYGGVWLQPAIIRGTQQQVVVAVKSIQHTNGRDLVRMHTKGVPVLLSLDSPWLVPVFGSIAEGPLEQPTAVHLIMQALAGNWVQLDRALIVPEGCGAMPSGLRLRARNNSAPVLHWNPAPPSGPLLQRLLVTFVDILEDFRDREITYSDIKPQNMMLDTQQVMRECPNASSFLALPWMEKRAQKLEQHITPKLDIQKALTGQVAREDNSKSSSAGARRQKKVAAAHQRGPAAAAAAAPDTSATTRRSCVPPASPTPVAPRNLPVSALWPQQPPTGSWLASSCVLFAATPPTPLPAVECGGLLCASLLPPPCSSCQEWVQMHQSCWEGMCLVV